MRARPTAGVLVLTASIALSARATNAQTRGFSVLVAGVADAETGAPLEGAEVLLPRSLRVGRANALGEAVLPDVPHGVQRVRVRRLGYGPMELDLAISGDTTGAVFRLRRVATPLGEVRVQADWMPPRMKDVMIRRRQGIGRYLEERDLARAGSQGFIDVVRFRFAGLSVSYDDTNNWRPVLVSRGTAKPCAVPIYLDDIYVPPGDADIVRTWDLALVEFYSAGQVPARYLTRGFGCGVLLLWSKWY